MSTRDQARRAFVPQRGRGRGPAQDQRPGPGESLPERLVAAREIKGVDLLRAERETKIRRTYLAALEAGDYSVLPGGVYARGFIRNYALYLGLDPEEMVGLYARELGTQTWSEPVLVIPKGIEAPRRALVIPPGLIAVALVGVAAVAILAYLAFQLVRFAEPPSLTVTDPADGITTVAEKTTSYTLRGTTVPGGEITIDAAGRETMQVVAGDDGAWAKAVELRNGTNKFTVNARDPRTKNTASQPVQLQITVPLSQVLAPTLAVDSPAEGASFQNGAIPIVGRASNATSVTATAAYVGAPSTGRTPPPSSGSSPRPTPAAPHPVDVTLADDGTFSSSISLTAGTWAVTVTARSDQGKTTSLTRAVTVAYQGVILVVDVKGGRAWMKVWVDGAVSGQTGSGGKTFKDGDTLTFRGQTSVEVWTGNPGATSFTLNGTRLGFLGPSTAPQTWLFSPPNAPRQTNRRD